MTRVRSLCLVLALLALVRTAGAQTSPATPLTLDDAIRGGLETSHRLAEIAARGEAAEAVSSQSRSAMLPIVSAQGGYMRTNHVDAFGLPGPTGQTRIIYPDVPDNFRSRLDVQWPIYTSGRLDALQRAAKAEAAASSDDLAVARDDLRLEITRAYWALVTAIEAERVVNESVASVGAHLASVRSQFSAGVVPPNDVLSVEAQEAYQRMLAVQARLTRDVNEAELGRLTGLEPETRIQPTATFELPVVPDVSVKGLTEDAKGQRRDRAALLKRIAAAEERTQAAGAGLKPTIAVAGGVDYAQPNPRIFPRVGEWRTSWDAAVNVNWPLFDSGRTRAAVAEARASVRAVRERVADFDLVLGVEIRQRLSEVLASRAAAQAAGEAIRSATEARRVLGERFSAGVSTSTDVIDAQRALLQAELERTQAVANARLAEARLNRALGR